MPDSPIPDLPLPAMPSRDASPAVARWRAAAFVRRHRMLLAMVLADALTKQVAFALLPHEDVVTLLPGLRLRLAVNEWGVMGGVQGLGPVASRPVYTLLLAAGLLVLAGSVVRLASSGLSFGRRLAAGVAVFLAVAAAAEAGYTALPNVHVPADLVVTAIRLAVLTLAVAFYAASRRPRARIVFTLLAAGAVANAVSFLHPPFGVVDFLVVPLAPLASLAARHGQALDDSTVGVINLADLYLFAFPLLLAAWPLAAAASRLVRRRGASPG